MKKIPFTKLSLFVFLCGLLVGRTAPVYPIGCVMMVGSAVSFLTAYPLDCNCYKRLATVHFLLSFRHFLLLSTNKKGECVTDTSTFRKIGRSGTSHDKVRVTPPYQTMQCSYCDEHDSTVTTVARCSDRCDVVAHVSCFERRNSTLVWKKKHRLRTNGDAEICPVPGCKGKLHSMERGHTLEKETGDTKVRTKKREVYVVQPENGCTFVRRDGTRCTRPVVCDGACRLHGRNAMVLKKMVAEVDENESKLVRKMNQVCTVATQTEDFSDELGVALAKVEHLTALHQALEEDFAKRMQSIRSIVV